MSTGAVVVPWPRASDLGAVVGLVDGVGRRPAPRRLPAVISEAFERAVRARSDDGKVTSLSLPELCAVCAEVTSMRASIVLVVQSQAQAAVATSDGLAPVEELQFTLGEGPGVDAFDQGHAVLVEDLDAVAARWLEFTPAARSLGVGAVFAFPLQLGAIRTGVLSLYADGALRLGDGRADELALLAGLVTDAVLAMQSDVVAGDLAWSLSNAARHRAVVHQATGMVAMQLGCPARDAFARLRARAFVDGVGVDEVAKQVVERTLRFEP
jgi:hypothetical protein